MENIFKGGKTILLYIHRKITTGNGAAKKTLFMLLILVMVLSACGRSGGEQEGQQAEILVLAAFDQSSYLRKQVELYNVSHDDYKIEIKEYARSEIPEEDGVLRLQREIVSGNGPDLIDFGNGYATGDIVGRYTEELSGCLGEEGRQACFDNILTAFSYQEGLYAIPLGFALKSFVGRTENLEGRSSWTIGEMLECFQEQEKERLLYPGAFKRDVFGVILTGSMEYYIDWETGECVFDGEEFRAVLEFCNGFSDRLEIEEDFSVKKTFLEDKALLLPVSINTVYDICEAELIFDGREVTFIGFPVESGCGTMIESCGPVLAVSRGSRHKEAAEEFIRQCLDEPAQRELPSGFPICRSVLEEQLKAAMEMTYGTDESGAAYPVVKHQVIFEGEAPTDIYSITGEQADRLLGLLEGADACSQTDRRIYRIFLDEAANYFSGAKSLEETADVIQARVSMYVAEAIK